MQIEPTPSNEDLKHAVLDAMWPLPCVNPSYTSREELDRERKRCDKWREWIAKTEMDDRARNAYKHWIEYCDYQNDRGEKELTLRTREKRMAEYDAEQKALRERVSKITVVKPETRI